MDYDPVKNALGSFVGRSTLLTRTFFALLQLFFLRAWYVRRELRRQIHVLERDRKLRVLDAGTGFGQFSWHLLRRYPEVTVRSVDVKEDYIARARAFFTAVGRADRIVLNVADLTKLEMDETYDLILSVDVMEHIEDDEAVFRNFKKALAPGGVVIINTPSDRGGSDVSDGEAGSFIGEHVRDGYSPDELAWKLSVAGLEVTRSTYTYGPAGSLAWRLTIKYPMLLLNRSRLFFVLLPFYYVVALPVGLLLNVFEMMRPVPSGTGLLVVAEHR